MNGFMQVVDRLNEAVDYFEHHNVPKELWQDKFRHLLTDELKGLDTLEEKLGLIEHRQREVTEAYVTTNN